MKWKGLGTRMLDFRMDTFIQVCKDMNYTKAANKLNITQPAVSQHIKYIEDYYGVKLFAMEGKKLYLTAAGKKLYKKLVTMQNDDKLLRTQLLEEVEGKRNLSFGVTLTAGEYAVGKALAIYLKENPDVNVEMVVENTHTLMDRIREGSIDFAIVEGHFNKGEFDYSTYSRERYIAVASPYYVFKKRPGRVEDLLGERILLREKGSGTREIFEKTLESRNYSIEDIENKIEVSSINVIKHLAMEGIGITFLYEVAVKEELKEGRLIKINLKDFNLIHDFDMIWNRGSIFTEYYSNMLNYLSR